MKEKLAQPLDSLFYRGTDFLAYIGYLVGGKREYPLTGASIKHYGGSETPVDELAVSGNQYDNQSEEA
jgi:hypothetical protein